MKKIAVTQRLIAAAGYPETRDALDVRWAALCAELNYLPILLPSGCAPGPYFSSVRIDGIILTGGNDLSSVVPRDGLSRKRDKFEKELVGAGLRRKIPILGVCRGMQLIADYFRGRLKRSVGHANVRHRLLVSDSSRYARILKKLPIVNSYHNYEVKCLPPDFTVAARSGDGAIEAIEHRKLRIFGLMWHPERERPFRAADLGLIKEIFR